MKCILLTTAATLGVLILSGILFVYSGIYDVSATSQDSGLFRWALETTRERSIDRRGEDIVPPGGQELEKPEVVQAGFDHYDEMCVTCHGAPGVEPGEARAGLSPKPPLLAKVAGDIPSGELFWVIKHGIKMTGMPAWGPTHSDDKIWAIVAFVRKLPGMSAAEYRAMRGSSVAGKHGHTP